MVRNIDLDVLQYGTKILNGIKINDELLLVKTIYNKNSKNYGKFYKVKVLDTYDSKKFIDQYDLLPKELRTKITLLNDLDFHELENYINSLKSLSEKIKDKTLLKLFGLSHDKENFKELSKDILKVRLK